jgi:putative hydrolase of the HAD superfamily
MTRTSTMTPAPLSNPTARAKPRAFAHIDTWVFDLDNTLYPHHLNLWQQVDERIRNYIAKFLNTTYDNAFRKQKDFYRRYGTTMRGMMIEHGMNPDDFLDFVHQIDHSPIEPNPALGDALERLPCRKKSEEGRRRKKTNFHSKGEWNKVEGVRGRLKAPLPLPVREGGKTLTRTK